MVLHGFLVPYTIIHGIRHGTPAIFARYCGYSLLASVFGAAVGSVCTGALQHYRFLRENYIGVNLVLAPIMGLIWARSALSFYCGLWGVTVGRGWALRVMTHFAAFTTLGTALIDYLRGEQTYTFLAFHARAGTPRSLITPNLREEYDRHIAGTALAPGMDYLRYWQVAAKLNFPVWAGVMSVDYVGVTDADIRKYIIRRGPHKTQHGMSDPATVDQRRQEILAVISDDDGGVEELRMLQRERLSGGL